MKKEIVLLGTFPPRECGIATFTQDLSWAMETAGDDVNTKIVAMNQSGSDVGYPEKVVMTVDQDKAEDFIKAALTINEMKNVKWVSIQHEYGIFGDDITWGEILLEFFKYIKKPVITTMHTVLANPDNKMKDVTQAIITYSTKVVVMTKHSKRLIRKTYFCDPKKLVVIPHGIHFVPFTTPAEGKKKMGLSEYTVLSTFGLLSRSKGIEYVIEALPEVIKKYPKVRYLVIGETHPVIKRKEGGDFYREELMKLVKKLKLEKHVKFYNKYISVEELLNYLKATDIYVATSLNPEQSVSGTFSYALGTGRAIVSTKFVQANEIVSHKIGRTVDFRSPQAYKNALLGLLSDPKKLDKMHIQAYKKTRHMVWENVGREYLKIDNSKIEVDAKYWGALTGFSKKYLRLLGILIAMSMAQLSKNRI